MTNGAAARVLFACLRPPAGVRGPTYAPDTPRRTRVIVIACAVGLALLATQTARGDTVPRAAQVKATYVYNFIQFIDWPAGSGRGGEFNACVLGDERFSAALRAFEKESIDGQRLRVRQLRRAEDAAALDCRLVFVTQAANGGEVLAQLPTRGVLTIGESRDFYRLGGMIYLYEVRGRVHFFVNAAAARQAGLQVSSRLLQLSGDPR